MTEAEWNSCTTDPAGMLEFLLDSRKLSDRKARLFAVLCCRRVWDTLHEIEKRAAIIAEGYEDGTVDEEKRAAAYEDVRRETMAAYERDVPRVALDLLDRDARFAAEVVVLLLPDSSPFAQVEEKAWCGILRELLGPLPFRDVPLDPAWLAWNDGVVEKLAASIYEGRAFQRMPILGDALEEAGCGNQEVLTHCRQQGLIHVRGCWLLDLLLQKA